jgi:hypothetical protein
MVVAAAARDDDHANRRSAALGAVERGRLYNAIRFS